MVNIRLKLTDAFLFHGETLNRLIPAIVLATPRPAATTKQKSKFGNIPRIYAPNESLLSDLPDYYIDI